MRSRNDLEGLSDYESLGKRVVWGMDLPVTYQGGIGIVVVLPVKTQTSKIYEL